MILHHTVLGKTATNYMRLEIKLHIAPLLYATIHVHFALSTHVQKTIDYISITYDKINLITHSPYLTIK